MSWGASRNLTKDEITARSFYPFLTRQKIPLMLQHRVDNIALLTSSILLHARQSSCKHGSALAYCKIALLLLCEEVEKKMEGVRL